MLTMTIHSFSEEGNWEIFTVVWGKNILFAIGNVSYSAPNIGKIENPGEIYC